MTKLQGRRKIKILISTEYHFYAGWVISISLALFIYLHKIGMFN